MKVPFKMALPLMCGMFVVSACNGQKKDEKKKVIRERQNWELLPGERKRRKRGILGLFN